MPSLRDELHPRLLLTWPAWFGLMTLAAGTLLSAIQLDWYLTADVCAVFLGIYGLAKVVDLALLAQPDWRRMLTVFVIFGLVGVSVVEGIAALHRRQAGRLAKAEQPKPLTPAVSEPVRAAAPSAEPPPAASAPPRTLAEKRPDERRALPPAVKLAPAPLVVTPSGQEGPCELTAPYRAPNVVLKPGEIVFSAEGGLLRLDAQMKAERILFADELAAIRGLVVEESGTILVSTHACGGGAVLRVDPKSGRQTLVATGFKTTKAIAIEPGGTVLVADEVGGNPTWGYLWRLDLEKQEKTEVYRFSNSPTEVATAMVVEPTSGDIFFTRQGLYRLTRGGALRISVDAVLRPTAMTMAGGHLVVSGAEPPAVELNLEGEAMGKMQCGGPVSNLAAHGKQVYVGYENGRVGRIRQSDREAENVWEGKPSNQGVFLAVVPER